MNNLMIDLETMGKKPNAPVVSIGAVFFEPQSGEIGPEFYTAVSLESAMEQSAVPDGDTIIWWLRQSPEARAAICADAVSVTTALVEFNEFITCHADNLKYLRCGATVPTSITLSCVALSNEPASPVCGISGTIMMYVRWLLWVVQSASIPNVICRLKAICTTRWPMPGIRRNTFQLSGRN